TSTPTWRRAEWGRSRSRWPLTDRRDLSCVISGCLLERCPQMMTLLIQVLVDRREHGSVAVPEEVGHRQVVDAAGEHAGREAGSQRVLEVLDAELLLDSLEAVGHARSRPRLTPGVQEESFVPGRRQQAVDDFAGAALQQNAPPAAATLRL